MCLRNRLWHTHTRTQHRVLHLPHTVLHSSIAHTACGKGGLFRVLVLKKFEFQNHCLTPLLLCEKNTWSHCLPILQRFIHRRVSEICTQENSSRTIRFYRSKHWRILKESTTPATTQLTANYSLASDAEIVFLGLNAWIVVWTPWEQIQNCRMYDGWSTCIVPSWFERN